MHQLSTADYNQHLHQIQPIIYSNNPFVRTLKVRTLVMQGQRNQEPVIAS